MGPVIENQYFGRTNNRPQLLGKLLTYTAGTPAQRSGRWCGLPRSFGTSIALPWTC